MDISSVELSNIGDVPGHVWEVEIKISLMNNLAIAESCNKRCAEAVKLINKVKHHGKVKVNASNLSHSLDFVVSLRVIPPNHPVKFIKNSQSNLR